MAAERTVLFRRSSLGDVVLLGAVTASLPGEVVVVTDARWRGVVERLGGVDQVISWPEEGDSLPLGRRVDLQGNRRSGKLVARGQGVRLHKHGLRRRARMLFPWISPRPPVTEIYARACGVSVAPLPWISLERKPGAELVLVPGAAWATKRWSAADFVRLGRRWEGQVSVLGGPGEEVLCRQIAGEIAGAEAFAGSGFEAAFKLFARAKVVVGGDTGLLHLAGACGVPVVMLFGPTHPADGFFVYPGVALGRDLVCRPCSLHGSQRCPLIVRRCMRIPVAEVLAAIEEAVCVG
jgi:hypothetical protein